MFALKSQRVLFPDGIRPGVVVVRGDRIAGLHEKDVGGLPTEDVGDAVVMPALTDCHVHINEPGRTEWEGFSSATRAAAVGGVTLLVDMPLNSIPVTTSVEALERKLSAAQGQLWVDCGFWGGVIPGNEAELAPMVRAGALGFKCFLCPSGIDEFPASTAEDLRKAMPILRDAGVPLLVHAEIESELSSVAGDPSPRLYANYLHSRPKEWEDRAVAMVIDRVRETGARAHIVHLSSANALALIRAAKAEGLPITAETCPHYLGLASEEIPDGATEYKCAPPIRERENRERLWAALKDGTLDFVVTDHSPCIPSLKLQESGDFLQAWGGIASLQLGLRSVWTEAQKRGIPLEKVSHWMSAATSIFAGQRDRGTLTVGNTADLILFHPEVEHSVEPRELLHRHPTSPWAGRMLKGRVQRTWMRGQVIAENGAPVGTANGKIVLGEKHE